MNSLYKCCIACNLSKSKFKNGSPSAHHGPLHNLNFPQNFHPSLFPLLLESLAGLMPLALATEINLFINSDAILNRDALWSIQGKKHYLQAAIVGGIHHTGKILR